VGRVAGTYLAWELCSNESEGALTRLCGRVLSLPTLPQAEPATDAFGDVPAGGHGPISVA